MKRTMRWTMRSIGIVGVAAALLWLAQLTVLPWIVRGQVDTALGALGLRGASFQVRTASLWGTQLLDVRGPREPVARISSVQIEYSPWSAVAGRLDSITLTGTELAIRYRDGRFSWGLRHERSGSAATTRASGADDEGPDSLPFDKLVLRDSMLVLELEHRHLRVPVSGTLTNTGSISKLDVEAAIQSQPLAITGQFDLDSGRVDLKASVEGLDLASVLLALPASDLTRTLRAGGQVAVDAAFHRADGQSRTTLSVRPREAWFNSAIGGHLLGGRDISLQIDAQLDGQMRPGDIAITGSVGRLVADRHLARDLTVSVERKGEKLSYRVAGEARPAGLALPAIPLSVQGTADATTSAGAWELKVPQARVVLGPADLELGAAKLSAARAELNLRGAAGPTGASVLMAPDSYLAYDSLQLVGEKASSAASMAATRIALSGPAGEQPLARIHYGSGAQDSAGATVAFAAATTQPLALKAPELALYAEQAQLSGSIRFAAQKPPKTDLLLALDGASFSHAPAELSLSGISGRIPITFNLAEAKDGTLTIERLRTDDFRLPPLSAALRIADGTLTFGTSWPLLKDNPLNARGWLGLVDGVPRGQITLAMPPGNITDPQALAAIWPEARDLTVTGTLALEGMIALEGGQAVPDIRLTAADVGLASKSYDLLVQGINGTVALSSFSPLTTPGAQRLTVHYGRMGKLEVVQGLVQFRVEGPESILVEQTQWGWAGGQLYSYGFRFDPADPAVDLVVYGEDLNVGKILWVISGEEAHGDGEVFGRLPVRVRWPRLAFGDGFLYSTPGGGTVQLGQTAGVVGGLMEQSDPRFASDPIYSQVKTRAVDALRNFQYDLLTTEFRSTNDGLVASVHIHGKGTVGPKPQELTLTVNATGLDRLLNAYLVMQQGQ